VQASNLPGLGLLTYGECWHNNHHAFPESARIGLTKGEADPAAWIIEALAKIGWTWNLGTPRPESQREDLELIASEVGSPVDVSGNHGDRQLPVRSHQVSNRG
jgi:stearoyl-CoA desaturase (delta-9 desaturase)